MNPIVVDPDRSVRVDHSVGDWTVRDWTVWNQTIHGDEEFLLGWLRKGGVPARFHRDPAIFPFRLREPTETAISLKPKPKHH
ncbi:MAG: hypothetical protein AAGC68_01795 [Verrucomicrobiota bacterium]